MVVYGYGKDKILPYSPLFRFQKIPSSSFSLISTSSVFFPCKFYLLGAESRNV